MTLRFKEDRLVILEAENYRFHLKLVKINSSLK